MSDYQASNPILLASECVTPPLTWTEVKGDHRLFLCDIYLEDTAGVSYSYIQYIDLAPEARPIIEYMKWDSGSTKSSRRQHARPSLPTILVEDLLSSLSFSTIEDVLLQTFKSFHVSQQADQSTYQELDGDNGQTNGQTPQDCPCE